MLEIIIVAIITVAIIAFRTIMDLFLVFRYQSKKSLDTLAERMKERARHDMNLEISKTLTIVAIVIVWLVWALKFLVLT